MKIEKQDLRENIEQLIGEGVINGEEIDVTTDKVLNLVWVLIDYLQTQGKNNVALADVVGQSEQLRCDKCGSKEIEVWDNHSNCKKCLNTW